METAIEQILTIGKEIQSIAAIRDVPARKNRIAEILDHYDVHRLKRCASELKAIGIRMAPACHQIDLAYDHLMFAVPRGCTCDACARQYINDGDLAIGICASLSEDQPDEMRDFLQAEYATGIPLCYVAVPRKQDITARIAPRNAQYWAAFATFATGKPNRQQLIETCARLYAHDPDRIEQYRTSINALDLEPRLVPLVIALTFAATPQVGEEVILAAKASNMNKMRELIGNILAGSKLHRDDAVAILLEYATS